MVSGAKRTGAASSPSHFGGLPEPPPASSDAVRRRMVATRRRDTPCELAIRRRVHARGLRYRVDAHVLPGLRRRADMVFRPTRVAVFVDGCFWHACPFHGRTPKAHGDWWAQKLQANSARDRDTDQRLGESGWCVLRFWEHDDPDAAADRIVDLVTSRRRDRGSRQA